jgi:poly-beta-1,6-N-acetyl-D-glucosamine synthase
MSLNKYVLITPARNEAHYIELTIKSVIAQTQLPLKWVIVSDGSTDGTDEIVKRYARHDWIELLRMPERKERHFAGKVHAFNAGYARLKDLDYGVIGSLDADISFEPDYFAFLLSKFAALPRLGVTGTPFSEGGTTYNYRFTSCDHVSGACQLFRRACFEDIGGYQPIKEGGIDLAAVVTARMKGWQTRCFTEKACEHHRKMGTGSHKLMRYAFKGGYHDYLMGVHPVWQSARCLYQTTRKPYFVWGALLLAGYTWAALRRARRPVSREFVAFRRREQVHKLRSFLGNLARGHSTLPAPPQCARPEV